MGSKKVFYTEAAYLVGLILLAMGAATMERADLGLSMVVAPAYILHLKLSQTLPFFSFGMAEYCLQAVILLLMMAILRRAKLKYLFSFGTAVLYGFILDMMMALAAFVPNGALAVRIILFVVGLLLGSCGVALLFHTYITPEVYELFVKEFADKYSKNIPTVKTAYDCISCLAAVLMSFAFFGFGHFEGVKLGTVFCALVNGSIIGFVGRWLDSAFDFRDGLKLRRVFE